MQNVFIFIIHSNSKHLLLKREKFGYSLPCTSICDGWVPTKVGSISQQLSKQLSEQATVLRFMSSRHGLLCEVEISHLPRTSALGFRWVEVNTRTGAYLVRPVQKQALRKWIQENKAKMSRFLAPWEKPGWKVHAQSWILAQLTKAGYKYQLPIEQVKAGWSNSCILKVNTHAGNVFFKASPNRGAAESTVIANLASQCPANVPLIIASDTKNNWMLMKEFKGSPLANTSLEEYKKAAFQYGKIQSYYGSNTNKFLGLGCPDWRVLHLPCLFENIIQPIPDSHKKLGTRLQIPTPKTLKRVIPRISSICKELSSLGIPSTIVCPDFQPGNIYKTPNGFLFYDWADAVVTHPFFSLARLLYYLPLIRFNSVDCYQSKDSQTAMLAISKSYLRSWTGYGPLETLFQGLSLVCKLTPVFQAIRWHQQLLASHPSSPWAHELYEARTRYLHICLKVE
jgi:hypothetical protein